jgi:hypothetical protein
MKCKYETTGWYEGMKRCLGTKEVDPCPGYDKCKNYTPDYQTNADRIRAMTDEELAKWLCEITTCECCRWAKWTGCEVRDWLKQPCKEKTDDRK